MVTVGFIRNVLRKIDDKEFRHIYYDDSVAIAEDIADTFSDKYPTFLDLDRPNEKKKDKEYRKLIFRNPCKSHKGRIIDKLQKVEQSEDFFINYPNMGESPESLKNYCEKGFRGYNSLKNWVFTTATKAYSDDPNAVIAVFDKNPPEDERQLYKPYPYLFKSKQVLLFEREKMAVLKSETGDVYYFFDDVNYYIVRKVEARKNNDGKQEVSYSVSNPIQHYCGVLPAFKVGRYIKEENEDGEQLFKSVFTDTLPYFQTALRRFNDIEVELVHHIHSKEWQIKARKCGDCKGSKTIMTTTGKQTCTTCNGRGVTSWGALDIIEVDFEKDDFMDGGTNYPFSAPGGVIERSIEPVKQLVESYQRLVQEAYDAVDMGLLNKIPTSQSGIAKEYDRLEYSQKMYAEGRHIIEQILLPIYRFIDAQRYTVMGMAGKQLPEVTVPISFDVMSPASILEELKLAEESGAGSEIEGQLRIKYSNLIFGSDSEQSQLLTDDYNLNPLYGYTIDEVISLYGGGMGLMNSFSEVDFVLGNNFRAFLKRAMLEDKNWKKRTNDEKRAVLRKFAEEIISTKQQATQLQVYGGRTTIIGGSGQTAGAAA